MTTPKKWLKITFPCPEKLTEAVSDHLNVLSGSGVEIHPVEGRDFSQISGFFELTEEESDLLNHVQNELKQIFSIYSIPFPELTTEIMDDEDWSTSWQQFFKPFEIAPDLIIKPTWETFTAKENQHILEMDPGMAFGTGQHESTRLALSHIYSYFQSHPQANASVLDVGTGTGILAMTATLFGAKEVIAIDNDPEAVRVAKENIHHNNLSKNIEVSTTDLQQIQGTFHLITANIIHDVLVEMAPDFIRLLAPGGHIILAGILAGYQEENIINLYEKKYGMQLVSSQIEEEWTGIMLSRND